MRPWDLFSISILVGFLGVFGEPVTANVGTLRTTEAENDEHACILALRSWGPLLISQGASSEEVELWQSDSVVTEFALRILELDRWLKKAPQHFFDIVAVMERPKPHDESYSVHAEAIAALQSNPQVQWLELLLDKDIRDLKTELIWILQIFSRAPASMRSWIDPLLESPAHFFLMGVIFSYLHPVGEQPVRSIDPKNMVSIRAAFSRVKRFLPLGQKPIDILGVAASLTNTYVKRFVVTGYEQIFSASDVRLIRQSAQRGQLGSALEQKFAELLEWLQGMARYYVVNRALPDNYSEAPEEWKKAFRLLKKVLTAPLDLTSDGLQAYQNILLSLQTLQQELFVGATLVDGSYVIPSEDVFKLYSSNAGRAANIVNITRALLSTVSAMTEQEIRQALHATLISQLLSSLRRYSPMISKSRSDFEQSNFPSLLTTFETPPVIIDEESFVDPPILPAAYRLVGDEFTEAEKDLSILRSHHVYNVQFLRSHHVFHGVQRVQFTPEAVEDLRQSMQKFGVHGSAFLRAIRMGMASYAGQQGLKDLNHEWHGYYEVKILASNYRLVGRPTTEGWIFEQIIKVHQNH